MISSLPDKCSKQNKNEHYTHKNTNTIGKKSKTNLQEKIFKIFP